MPCQTFSIPDCHPTLNQWAITKHHYARHKLKKEWEELTIFSAKADHLKPVKGEVEVSLIYSHPWVSTKRKIDIDNFTPKFIMDALVTGGFIEDDSFNVVKKLSWTFVKGARQTVVKICTSP